MTKRCKNYRLKSQLRYSGGLKFIPNRRCQSSQNEQIVGRFSDTFIICTLLL